MSSLSGSLRFVDQKAATAKEQPKEDLAKMKSRGKETKNIIGGIQNAFFGARGALCAGGYAVKQCPEGSHSGGVFVEDDCCRGKRHVASILGMSPRKILFLQELTGLIWSFPWCLMNVGASEVMNGIMCCFDAQNKAPILKRMEVIPADEATGAIAESKEAAKAVETAVAEGKTFMKAKFAELSDYSESDLG